VDAETLELLKRMEAGTVRALTQRAGWISVGPFLASFHATSDLTFMNYAIPAQPDVAVHDLPRTVGRLRELFRERKRTLRFEFLEPVHRGLGKALAECGLALEREAPLMICERGKLVDFVNHDVQVLGLDAHVSDGTLRQLLVVGQRGFGFGDGKVTAAEIAEQREHLAAQRYRCAYATIDGVVAGIGSMTVQTDELVGIATLPEYRRRGVAASVSSFLVRQHFQKGGHMAWLSAGDEAAEAVYRKIGFRKVGVQSNYIDAGADKARPT
jgi:ribosomal protein S18 acetylase RimI-like enzyme